MPERSQGAGFLPGVVFAVGEEPNFQRGDRVRIMTRCPIGHYRVPLYLRGKTGTAEAVIEPAAIDNEEEGYGRNAGANSTSTRLSTPRKSAAGSRHSGPKWSRS